MSLLWGFLLSSPSVAAEFDYRQMLFLDGKRLAETFASRACEDSNTLNFDDYAHVATPLQIFTSANRLQLDGTPGAHTKVDKTTQDHLDEFERWIAVQADNSITPQKLALEALKVSRGNVLSALRLSYNVLMPKNPQITAKLIDITGERLFIREAYRANPGDPLRLIWKPLSTRGGSSSSWYHFFGAAMVTFDEATKRSPVPLSPRLAARNAYIMGRMVGDTMVEGENLVDRFTQFMRLYGPVDFRKRHLINKQGVHFGANLARYLILAKADLFRCGVIKEDHYYLYDNPEILGSDYALEKDERPNDRGVILKRKFINLKELTGR